MQIYRPFKIKKMQKTNKKMYNSTIQNYLYINRIINKFLQQLFKIYL